MCACLFAAVRAEAERAEGSLEQLAHGVRDGPHSDVRATWRVTCRALDMVWWAKKRKDGRFSQQSGCARVTDN